MILLGRNKSLVYSIYVCKHFIRNVYKKWLIFVSALNARDQTRPDSSWVELRLEFNSKLGEFGQNGSN
jgi:hypothetical protein